MSARGRRYLASHQASDPDLALAAVTAVCHFIDMKSWLPAVEQLLDPSLPPELGPGPRSGVKSLDELKDELEIAFRATPAPPRTRELVRALVLLWHDHLDAAHRIVQNLADADGSLIHALMHRREPDFGNSQYWFRRAGAGSVFQSLPARIGRLPQAAIHPDLIGRLLPGGVWDPLAFVDLCETLEGVPSTDPRVGLAVAIQEAEFRAVLSHLAGE